MREQRALFPLSVSFRKISCALPTFSIFDPINKTKLLGQGSKNLPKKGHNIFEGNDVKNIRGGANQFLQLCT